MGTGMIYDSVFVLI